MKTHVKIFRTHVESWMIWYASAIQQRRRWWLEILWGSVASRFRQINKLQISERLSILKTQGKFIEEDTQHWPVYTPLSPAFNILHTCKREIGRLLMWILIKGNNEEFSICFYWWRKEKRKERKRKIPLQLEENVLALIILLRRLKFIFFSWGMGTCEIFIKQLLIDKVSISVRQWLKCYIKYNFQKHSAILMVLVAQLLFWMLFCGSRLWIGIRIMSLKCCDIAIYQIFCVWSTALNFIL